MHFLTSKIEFPDIDNSSDEGLLAIGGDLSIERLMLAYRSGIFPWYEEGQPILWWSPNPRMVLFPSKFKVSNSLKKTIDSNRFTITCDANFQEVIRKCATIVRKDQTGTWITNQMIDAFIELYKKGFAHSIEVWTEEELVGGLYGIDLPEKRIFCGESMFSVERDASKVALYHLVKKLTLKNYQLIDCQIYTRHLEKMGAEEIPRNEFQDFLKLV